MRNHANAGRGRGITAALLVIATALCACLALGVSAALAVSLPDGRGYEMVTPLDKNGLEVGTGIPAIDGHAVNWEAPGGCCGATSAAQTLYQSTRTANGWQTKALTPTPSRPLVGVNEEQAPVFWTGDLSQTIFQTPASYAAGDERPKGSGALDLYLQDPSGSLTWLSQGSFPGSGSTPATATFDGATPDAKQIVFSSAAQLTPEATGLSTDTNEPVQYLYERNVAEGTTKLVNVVNTTLAADARGPIHTTLSADATGTTTAGLTTGAGPAVATTLTANALADETTIVVANTEGLANGEQIAVDTGGSEEIATIALVLDTTELMLSTGLAGDHAAGAAVAHAADSTITVNSTAGFAAGQSIAIETEAATVAAVTDGTHLELGAALATPHPAGGTVTHDGETSIVVASTTGLHVGDSLLLDAESPQRETVSIATIPDGTHLTLTAPLASSHAAGAPVLYEGDGTITVASTAAFIAGQSVRIDTGAAEETTSIAAIPDGTHLTLSANLPHSHAAGVQIAQLVGTLGAILGNGSYIGHPFLPADATGTTTNAVSSDGSKVFFESPTPGVTSTSARVEPHLYMRDESDGTTTAVDDPASNGMAHYEGAAQDGSLVFFSSSEALGGEPLLPPGVVYNAGVGPGDNELYEFNTTDRQIGPAPPMSVVPVSGGNLSFSTSLAAEAGGEVSTRAPESERNFVATEGATSIPVVSSAGFFPGEKIHVGNSNRGSTGEACPRPPGSANHTAFNVIITGASDATHLALAEPLPPGYCVYRGVLVTYQGDTSLTLHTTTGVVPGEILEIEGERVTVESVADATHVAIRGHVALTHPAGAPITSVKIQDGSVIGVTAISNDGSHVYFVAENILAENLGAQGKQAVVHKPNLYVFDTASGQTTFIAKLASPDVNDCLPSCSQENPYTDTHPEESEIGELNPEPSHRPGFFGIQGNGDGLVAEPDVARPTVPTPNGSVLVFDSSGDLTGQDPGPATTLSAEAEIGDRTLAVASTDGFAVGHTITIGTGIGEELAVIESIPDATHLALTETSPAGLTGLIDKHSVGAAVTQLHSELYRYEASNNSLKCISCTPAGVAPTGSATLGAAGGGSYGPPDTAVPMNESGSEVFFQTPDPLVSEDVNGGSFANGPFGSTAESMDVYEWHEGKVSLISDGTSPTGAFLDGTTPSGNDVFVTTREQLVSGDSDGYADIYDARVGGGLPQPSGPAKPCTGSGCRQANGASVFFSVPASATVTGTGNLTPPSLVAPSFTVGSVSAVQRAASARSGKLPLQVSATAAGKLTAVVFASMHGKSVKVGTASVTLGRAGKRTLTLHLNKTARKALAKQGRLALRIEVSYSGSGTVRVATLTLSRGKASKASAHGAAVASAQRGRIRGA
jgi:hypothetical protein